MSFQFGAVQGSASTGVGFGGGSSMNDRGVSGNVALAEPMQEEIGSLGWNV